MALAVETSRALSSSCWRHVLAGMLFTVLTAAAFPPLGVWPLTLAALVPLVWAGYHPARRPVLGAACVSLGTLPLWAFQERWLLDVTQPGYPMMALYLALYPGVFVALLTWMSRRFARAGVLVPGVLLVAILWTALEFVRGEIALTGYAWFLVGQPLIELPFLASPARLFGAYVVSFAVAALCGALADATGWTPVPRRVGCVAAGVVAAGWIVAAAVAGAGRALQSEPAGSLRVAVVQTNLPQNNKLAWTLEQRERDFEQFVKLTRDAAALRPPADLICWPETMYPGYALNPAYIAELTRLAAERRIDPGTLSDVMMFRRLEELQREVRAPMVVGAQALEGFRIVPPARAGDPPTTDVDRRYNSVFVVENGQVRSERYDKIELTPFGEVIPYVWRWKSVQGWIESVGAGGMKFDLSWGEHAAVLPLDVSQGVVDPRGQLGEDHTVRFCLLTPICFEATKSELCRRLTLAARRDYPERARLLINLSNDGWFGDAAGRREQHMLAARWRCVELGLPMVRGVNTGISCWIDARGAVQPIGSDGQTVDPNAEGVFAGGVTLGNPARSTLFTRIGNAFGWGVLVTAAALTLVGCVLGRRSPANR